jgi:hypothetical protein
MTGMRRFWRVTFSVFAHCPLFGTLPYQGRFGDSTATEGRRRGFETERSDGQLNLKNVRPRPRPTRGLISLVCFLPLLFFDGQLLLKLLLLLQLLLQLLLLDLLLLLQVLLLKLLPVIR